MNSGKVYVTKLYLLQIKTFSLRDSIKQDLTDSLPC